MTLRDNEEKIQMAVTVALGVPNTTTTWGKLVPGFGDIMMTMSPACFCHDQSIERLRGKYQNLDEAWRAFVEAKDHLGVILKMCQAVEASKR